MSNQPPVGMPMAPQIAREPGAIKTFAVLHLVIAGIGVLTVLYQTLSFVFSNKVMGAIGKPPEIAEIQASYMKQLSVFSWAGIVFSLILIVMLFMAGLALLKAKDRGRILSLRYAWTSIVMKVISAIVTIVWVMPISKRMMEEIYQGMPAMPAGFSSIMSTLVSYSTLIIILLTLAYPIVVLVMMRNEKIKNYLAGR
jgi:hypothetical protein